MLAGAIIMSVLHGPCVSGWVGAPLSSLSEALELDEGALYEVVVTTFSDDGSPHAAAMGCRFFENASTIILRPHVSSQTARNLSRTRCGVVNVAAPEFIVEAALDLGVVSMSFGVGEAVEAPVLCEAYAAVEFFVVEELRDDVWLQARCRPVAFRFRPRPQRPFSRPASLLVEASVSLSRVEPFLSMNRGEEASRLWLEARALVEEAERLAGGAGVLGSLAGAVRRRLASLEWRISL
ncbi:MAG: DUF447 family protein [Nitrososphaerota archaeon]